jgi:hypothetical protein
MSTSEPKKDEAPASETTAAPSEPEPETKTAAKPDDSGAKAAADRAAANQTGGEPAAGGEAVAKTETAAADQPDAAEEKARAEEPVWPPPESQPVAPEGGQNEGSKDDGGPSEGGKPEVAEPALLTKPDAPVGPKPAESLAPEGRSPEGQFSEGQSPDSPPATADAAAKPAEAAAEPGQEMTLSESTLHWLVDGELPIEPTGPNPTLAPIYDSHAPVAGRKRTVAVIGGAAVLALGVAWALHAQAAHHEKAAAVAPSLGSADLLIHRAEAALAQGRSAEALDLARLATVTDPHYAEAYVVMAEIQKSTGQAIDARDSYRRYLDLAPLGSHAAEARAALKTLPP